MTPSEFARKVLSDNYAIYLMMHKTEPTIHDLIQMSIVAIEDKINEINNNIIIPPCSKNFYLEVLDILKSNI